MRLADIVRLRIRSLLKRGKVEQELDDELRFHLESAADRYQAEGMTRDEAMRKARIELGSGVENIREECRDARGWSPLENVMRDVAYSLRGLRKSPLFTVTAVGALALGIGVNTAVFTLFYALVMRPLPVVNPETMRNVHVVVRGEGDRSSYGMQYFVSFDEFRSMRAGARTADLAGVAEVSLSRKDDPRPVRAQLVSPNYLSLIGARPALGRLIAPEEAESPGSAAVVVLSWQAWQNWFGGDSAMVGRQVVLNRMPFTIVGVADKETTGPLLLTADVWIPYTMQAMTRPGDTLIDKPSNAWIQILGRIKPGFSDEQMKAEMQVLAQAALSQHSPKQTATVDVETGAFFNFPFLRSQGRPILAIISLAVTLVLIVACANVANMLLARGLSRRREIAIRLSIGAGRARLLQQLLTESVVLALLGGIAGLGLAVTGARAVVGLIPAEMIGRHQLELTPDGGILSFTLGVSLLTGIVFGLIPAWNSLRFDLSPAIKSEGLSDASRSGRNRLQFGLISVQVAVCLVLLVNASLLLRGFQSALHSDPGQSTKNVMVASFDLRQQQHTADQATRFIQALRENAGLIPGVRSVATTMVEPLHQQCGNGIRVVGSDNLPGPNTIVACDEISPDYFRTMNIRLLQGRDFTRADQAGAAKIAIVDEEFARTHFGGAALGRYLRQGERGADVQIVGVVAHTRVLDLGRQMGPKMYSPMRGLRHVEAKIVASYEGSFGDIERQFRQAAAALDGNVNVRVRPIEESLTSALVPARIATAAAACLGGFALLLAASGIYGVVAFSVTRRRKEMGIRVALGADRSQVLGLMIWQGMKPVVAGAVVGLGLAAAGAQLIRAMLYGVSPFDPVGFAGTALLLAIVALVASVVPARSALAVDPSNTLRHE